MTNFRHGGGKNKLRNMEVQINGAPIIELGKKNNGMDTRKLKNYEKGRRRNHDATSKGPGNVDW
jgi:hypothetical protein